MRRTLGTGDRTKLRFEGSVGSSLQDSGREDDMPTWHFESTDFDYEHSHTHLVLVKDAPESRAIQLKEAGIVVELPQLGCIIATGEEPAAQSSVGDN